MKKIQACVVLSILISNICFAAPRSADAEQFDIAGVKLGMSKKAAITAITQKLGLGVNAVKFDEFSQVNPVTKTKEPAYFTVKTANMSVVVHMQPKVPYDANEPMVVSIIIYEQPWTQQNALAMKKMALEKYGKPSNGVIGVAYHWCIEPHSNPGFGCSEFYGPKLVLSGTRLRLEDTQYQQAVIDFMNKRKTSKPVF
ncbi:hypothetical protein KCM76_00815 [Zooshikella marina]|uniref:hypothetical protein n=1 Tax=Zooshikella ganghwensis TaxID=202772 RepID=UPI001BB02582|nr:hypothetical protein [Zooshikella ganghwensis]MBU2704502.1 hypothetical protein [Zooshikella ganghwensis]